MERPQYMPLYWNDLMNDEKVQAMLVFKSEDGRVIGQSLLGVYLLLLHRAWFADIPASLPNNDAILAGYAGLDVSTWQQVKPVVMACFTLSSDGRYHQRKMRQVYEEVVSKQKQAKKAAESRWQNKKGDADAMRQQCPSNAGAMPEQCGSNAIKTKQMVLHTHTGVPQNEQQAIEWGEMSGVPSDFSKQIYNQLEGRNWVDGAGQPVGNFRNYLAHRWSREQSERAEKQAKSQSFGGRRYGQATQVTPGKYAGTNMVFDATTEPNKPVTP